MDALSDVLRVISLEGGVFLEAQFAAPWAIVSQVEPQDLRHALPASAAALVGYASEAAFSRAFKREAGVAPSAWKRRE